MGKMNRETNSHSGKEAGETRFRIVCNIPNCLTLIRLIAIAPLAVMIYRWPANKIATFILFLLIWATDFLDGYIARRFNMMTEFGKLFDPFVDKVFQVVTTLMMFAIGRIPIWVPLFYVVRESFMLFGSTLLLTRRQVVVFSDRMGKLATFLFVVAMILVFWLPEGKRWLMHVIFIAPVLLSFLATIHYIRQQAGATRKNHDPGENAGNA